MDLAWVPVVIAVGVVLVGGFVAQALGKAREQRIVDLREELKDERELCDRQIHRLREELSEVRAELAVERGRVDTLQGDFASQIADRAAAAVIAHVRGEKT